MALWRHPLGLNVTWDGPLTNNLSFETTRAEASAFTKDNGEVCAKRADLIT
jgi:hypothetical protein